MFAKRCAFNHEKMRIYLIKNAHLSLNKCAFFLYPIHVNSHPGTCLWRKNKVFAFELELIPILDVRVRFLDRGVPEGWIGITQDMPGQPAEEHCPDQGNKYQNIQDELV
jgi:hypothetical protein